jgi:hypothetical protein
MFSIQWCEWVSIKGSQGLGVIFEQEDLFRESNWTSKIKEVFELASHQESKSVTFVATNNKQANKNRHK